MEIRNVAIIAHVDHGKTTLVDAFLKQTGVFRENQRTESQILDSNALERERGITILAKNTGIFHQGIKINIVDTPGHVDFGGEVERVIGMVDGALLVVDSAEGPLPQTRYVLQKAFAHNLKPIVVINKIDRKDARPYEVVEEVLELFLELDATDEQADFSRGFGPWPGKVLPPQIWPTPGPTGPGQAGFLPLLDLIITRATAPVEQAGPLQLLVTNLEYDEYVGRLALGRIQRGASPKACPCRMRNDAPTTKTGRVEYLYTFARLERIPVEAQAGDRSSGGTGRCGHWGHHRGSPEVESLPALQVDEPTLTVIFRINDGPLAGREGNTLPLATCGTAFPELQTNVALQVNLTDSPDA